MQDKLTETKTGQYTPSKLNTNELETETLRTVTGGGLSTFIQARPIAAVAGTATVSSLVVGPTSGLIGYHLGKAKSNESSDDSASDDSSSGGHSSRKKKKH